MPAPFVSTATTSWDGELFTGSGTTTLSSSGLGDFPVHWKARTESHDAATSPEELLAAAHATCYTMQFSNMLKANGTPPTHLDTIADVTFVAGEGVTKIVLKVNGTVDGISAEDFAKVAGEAKDQCPISVALAGVKDMSVEPSLA